MSRASGMAFCEKHFLEYFDRKVRRTLRRYKLFGPEEKIVVAVSGGKDSMSLLHYLLRLSKRVPGWRVAALLVDEGIRGYREYTIERFLRFVEEHGVEYRIARFRDEFGYTLDEIVKIGKERGLPYLPCTYCGVFRRYLMNKTAREMGATVVATAHNLDDLVQTYLMNVFNNDWDKIARLGPISGPGTHPRFVRKVKPFYEVLEKETTIYAVINGLYTGFEECPYARLSVRWYIRRMLNELEERSPGVKYSLLRSLQTAIRILEEAGRVKTGDEEEGPYTCAICGEPSAHPICRACQLRLELGILKLSEERLRSLPEAARRMALEAMNRWSR
ncbi:putative ATPase of the PP-loop superfamily [Hyperthermus butylicus DSM 5456]|uniref:ATPase of the PP-loop superfamily n=1 Tax=Hyperthermus butylicus (strain DSM 5456 / JCM 9403 / PLM1-5) TaxID=415426 RepID=A2BKE0_HYPBU|nr:putative ATPase of the PP-loop superfamily [Hyperthermus butylicus DSM 5456]